jgi:hypothetical protein
VRPPGDRLLALGAMTETIWMLIGVLLALVIFTEPPEDGDQH